MNSSIESSSKQVIAANQSQIASLEGESFELDAQGKTSESMAIKDHIGQLKSQIATAEKNIELEQNRSDEKAVQDAGKVEAKPEEKLDKNDSTKSEETKNSKKDQEEKTELGQTGNGTSAGSSTARKGPVISDAA